MNIAANPQIELQQPSNSRQAIISDHPSVFTEIYQQDVNIAIWQRELTLDVKTCVKKLLDFNDQYATTLIVTPKNIHKKLTEEDSELINAQALCDDIAELVDMFCLLYELKQVGLRLSTLDRAMCPRFHVDKVPCRLVCTYHGVATEWLPHNLVDRSKLGTGNKGLADEESGIYRNNQDINRLNTGDVAMLKGEIWQGNQNAGLVHRSPQVKVGEKRLLLTLDFID